MSTVKDPDTEATRPSIMQTLTTQHEVNWRQYTVYIGFVLVFILFAILLQDRGFLSERNLLNIVRQTTTISVMAVAMTFALTASEFDLSVGAVVGLAAVNTAVAIDQWGLLAGVAAGLGTGLIVGAVNGWIRTWLGLPTFLVTLGTMALAQGMAMGVRDGAPIAIREQTFNFWFGSGSIGRVPVLLGWTILVVVIGHIVYTRTRFGRHVLATGGNVTAAVVAGVPVDRIRRRVLLMTAGSAGLAGLLYSGRLQSGRWHYGGPDDLLSVIAAVVLGGTSLWGGSGTIIGSFFGSLLIGTMNNGLILLGLNVGQQLMARGVIILVAIALNREE